jgi:hypothetical protein
MTHDEWISDLNKYIAVAEIATPATAQLVKALRAVMELHSPSGIFCRGCGFNEEYNEPAQLLPCPTIQAIEKELV